MLRIVFMSVIALFLLGLYGYAVWYSIQTLRCINASQACTDYALPLSDGIKEFLALIGGLVSALVISVLAITPSTGSPVETVVVNLMGVETLKKADVSKTNQQLAQFLTYLYLAIWLIGGMCMVIFSMAFDYKKPVAELTVAAKAWLGLAIAAAYAYFGLKPVAPQQA